MSMIRAEYIWIDGTEPDALIRSKTKVIKKGKDLPDWGFDGSSTNQATGDASDCMLRPVFTCPDPFRGPDDVLVLCEVNLVDGTPHPTNTRAQCRPKAEAAAAHDTWFGLEQEYTFMKGGWPYGFPERSFPGPQGPYYCGVGATLVAGRDIVEKHLEACLYAGLGISGINAEVMPGQWEFQIGPLTALECSDHVWMARYLLYRIAETYDVEVSLEGKPMRGDWNGAGCHTNFSTKEMRESYDAIIAACEALGKRTEYHIENYGHGIEERLTGKHETASYKTFSYGVSDRGASIRIPWQCAIDKKGYAEDRRPNANMDPYRVTRVILETICGV